MQPVKTRTADEAIRRWPDILQTLGFDPQYLRNKHGPCPICGGKDRYRFDDRNGRGTWICSRCGSGDGFDLLRIRYGWSFSHAAKEIDRIIDLARVGVCAKQRTEEEKIQTLRKVWAGSRPVSKGDPVWRYLNNRIGIDIVPPDLRFHPALKHSDAGSHPTMLALLRYPDGAPASIHRTYLTNDGEKAPVSEVKKFMQGKPLKKASVQLGAPDVCLGVAEGIETALAASIRFGVPVWAAGNAGQMKSWLPPAGVNKILIAAYNDKSHAGQAAAHSLANRLVQDGYAVEIKIPGRSDTDWADGLNDEPS